jgi:hypothetical protein
MVAKYDHIDFKPPKGVREEAAKGLEWRREYGRGGTEVGVARARDLSNGKNISPETARRMNSYFARHAVDEKGEGWEPGEEGFPSAGRIAWALWGGDAGKAWASKLAKQMDAADSKERAGMDKGKIKRTRIDTVPESRMVMRFAEIRSETAQPENRSVGVVVATENPVERYDRSRGIVLREVLEMDGIELRGGRNQLPIVDSHDRSTVANVLGSVRNLRVDGDELVGEAYFASDEESQRAYQKLLDGHLTDFSITATPREVAFVERGKTYTTRRGGVVDGPADIVTRWTPTDASLVATGADERSVVRRSYTDLPEEIKRMDEGLAKQLQALGMPAEIADAEAALQWMAGYMASKSEPEMEEIESAMDEEPKEEMSQAMDEEVEKAEGMDKEEELKMAVDRAMKIDRERRREITAACDQLKIERSFAEKLCDEGVSISDARKLIIERAANKPLGQGATQVRVTESEADKFYAAAKAGLIQRAATSAGIRMKVDQAPGSDEFRYAGLRQLAESFVERMGVNTRRLAPKDVALIALGHQPTINRHNIQRDAYHTTGSFANLLLDAANKTLLAGYEEAPYTWSQWARQGTSVADFKAINRIRFSEVGNPEMVPEKGDYPESRMSDSKESYQVEKYGSVFTVSWETVVNDDLDAISRIPSMQGAACRRKQNATVYGVLTANANLSDGGALFNSTAQTSAGGHANLAGSTGAPSVTTLNAGFLSMMTKKGLNSDAILNIVPATLIVPAALGATALQLVGSFSDPLAGGSSTTGNSNTLNIYGPNGSRPLAVVIEPVLDANSATAWYLAASPTQVDTVEITFLQGEESPVLENEWDFDKDCYKYKVRQTWGVAAIDFRGLFKNAG